MGLDAHGIIAVVEIVIYVPILFVGGYLSLKHGFTRKAGWIFLVLLAIVRIAGGITHILSENNPTNTTERVVYSIMESSGLSPLLLATLGFLGTVSQHSIDDTPVMTRGTRLVSLVGLVALILSIVGGVNLSSVKSQADLDHATLFRRVGASLFVVFYAGAVLLTCFCWSKSNIILKYRRQLLMGITATLPFLAVRVAYSVLSAVAPYPYTFVDGQQVPVALDDSALAKFSLTSSSWGIYLAMSVLMEYIAVVIYVVVGVITPLSKDELERYGRMSPSLIPARNSDSNGYGYAIGSYSQGGSGYAK
ncbi:hypothetical protein C8Q80DRAFT_1225239 [Daedaleopsis nitida]|nr:hypothetical protein C8Q80DRAFT_1225239 [Daedaleopsis nitida]